MKKNITQKNIAVVLLILCVCLNMFPVSVGQQKEIKIVVSEDYSGNILYVGGSGSNNYTKIQDAINDSQNGDTVFVYNDSSPYYERIFINKSISLIGEDQQSTIIDGQSSPLTGVTITADSVVLKRFTISHSMYDGIENSVIDISSDAIIISENTISENQVIHDIYFHSSQNCIFSNNTLSEAFFHGIIVSYCINCTFSGNVLYDNYDNFEILDSSNNSFLNNQMTGSDYYHGFFLSHSNSNIFSGNSIIAQSFIVWGILVIECTDNLFVKNRIQTGGLTFDRSSENIVLNNTISDCNYDGGLLFGEQSQGHLVVGNLFINNSVGIRFWENYNNNNVFYHNTFKNNSQQVMGVSDNIWDNGYPSGGNYWDDYNGTDWYSGLNQDIPGSDGIGDTPYTISGGTNVDRYPFGPFVEDQDPPFVTITKPQEALYLRNQSILPLKVPVILGFITIEVNATDDQSGVNKIDFYIDGVLKETDTIAPYSWTWSERTPFKFKHTIKVIATDNTLENTASAESVVWKFF